MQQVEFTPEEMEILREVIKRDLDEIDVEVFRTDTHDFKQMLKRRRDTLQHISDKVAAAPALA